MKTFAKKFYKSVTWRKCRDTFFVMKYGICDRCGGPGKIVHHSVYLTPENIDDPTISLNHDLLELHCQKCHNKEHHSSSSVIKEGLKFDSNGDLLIIDSDKKFV